MSNHSVIEHRANYHFLKVEEDYLAICSVGNEAPHCKGLILAILEHWTNTKRDQEQGEWVYLSLPEWVEQTYEFYGRNVLINCLKELLDDGLIERRAIVRYDQDTFEYKLNIDAIQTLIRALPEKAPKDIKPNLAAYRELQEQKRVQREKERKAKEQDEEGSLNLNGGVVEKSTPLKSKRGVVEKSTQGRLKKDDTPLKSKRNIDSSLTSFPASSGASDGAANADTPARTLSLEEKHVVGDTPDGHTNLTRGTLPDGTDRGPVQRGTPASGALRDQDRTESAQQPRSAPRPAHPLTRAGIGKEITPDEPTNGGDHHPVGTADHGLDGGDVLGDATEPQRTASTPLRAVPDQRVPAAARRGATPARTGSRAGTPAPVIYSEPARAFLVRYCALPWIKIPPKETEQNRDYCEQFAPHLPDEESFYSLRHYMDGKPFFKGKGFTFGLIACALNEWAMSREEAPRQTRSAPPVVSEEKIQKALALKAALLADLQASKLAPVALGGAK